MALALPVPPCCPAMKALYGCDIVLLMMLVVNVLFYVLAVLLVTAGSVYAVIYRDSERTVSV